MIICGDFLQLPPVADFDEQGQYPEQRTYQFAFNSRVWKSLFKRANMYNLSQNHRQADKAFQMTLERVRRGSVISDDMEALYRLQRPVIYPDGVEPVSL